MSTELSDRPQNVLSGTYTRLAQLGADRMARMMEAMLGARANGELEFHAGTRPNEQAGFSLRTVFQILASGACYYLATRTAWVLTFPDSKVGAVHRAPADFPSGKKGDVLVVEFTVVGIPCIGLNGGPEFKHSEAFSFQIATDDQAETDRLWNAIVKNGGQESACGWCKDKWGLSWQITPRALTDGMADPDPAVNKRVFEAMMEMKKIDVAAIEAARRG